MHPARPPRQSRGDAVMTRYGNVQVQITVQGGKITAADVLQVPWNDRARPDDQLAGRADLQPGGRRRAVGADRHRLRRDVHWDGYTQSLQSAIDQANL